MVEVTTQVTKVDILKVVLEGCLNQVVDLDIHREVEEVLQELDSMLI